MDFPKNKATELTEEIMSDVRSQMKLDTWHYNRVFESVYKVMSREFGQQPSERPSSDAILAADICSKWFTT